MCIQSIGLVQVLEGNKTIYTSEKINNMYTLLFWNNIFDQKVKNIHLLFFLVFPRIRGKRTRAKDQKQTIYFKRPYRLIGIGFNPMKNPHVLELIQDNK